MWSIFPKSSDIILYTNEHYIFTNIWTPKTCETKHPNLSRYDWPGCLGSKSFNCHLGGGFKIFSMFTPFLGKSNLKLRVDDFYLGDGFKYISYFHPFFGEDFQFDEHIFQMGWFKPPTSQVSAPCASIKSWRPTSLQSSQAR